MVQLHDRLRSLPIGGPNAVGPCITAPDDYDVLAPRRQHAFSLPLHAAQPFILLNQILHGEVNTAQVAAGNVEITGLLRPASQNHSIMVFEKLVGGNGYPDVYLGPKLHPFGLHLRYPPIDVLLLDLEIRDAVTQQSSDAVLLLVDHNAVPCAAKLLRSGKPRRPRADDSDPLSATMSWDLGMNPTFFPPLIDDGTFNRLDGDGVILQIQRARRLAGRWAQAPRELREVVGGVKNMQRLPPIPARHQIVPIWNDVIDRTTGMAVRNATFHASQRLSLDLILPERNDKLVKMAHSLANRFPRLILARDV